MSKKTPQQAIVNLLEAMLLILLVLVAAYVSLGRMLIPRVDDYRPQIERLLSAALNVPVHIQALSGEWHYLDPRLEIDGFRIGNDTAGITFNRLTVELNSFQSLLERDLVVSDLFIDSLSLRLTQNPSGAWQIDGMPVAETPPDLSILLTSLPYLESVEMTSLHIDVEGQLAHYQIRNQPDQVFELRADGAKKSMSLPLSVQKLGENSYNDSLQLLGEYRGDPRELDSFFASLYLQVPSIELADLIRPVEAQKFEFTELGLGGEFWLDFDGSVLELRGSTLTGAVRALVDGQQLTLLKDLRSEFSVVRKNLNEVQVYFESLSAEAESERIELNELSVFYRNLEGDQSLVAYLPTLSIDSLVKVVTATGQRTALLPEKTNEVLSAMALSGELEQLFFYLDDLESKPVPHFSGLVRGLALGAYAGVPGISHLDGFVSLGQQGGFLDIHNDGNFKLDFGAMFPSPWSFDSAHARLNYTVTPEAVQISSGLIKLTEGQLVAAGRVQINLPPDRENHTWGLEIGIRRADLSTAHRYLPEVLSPTLREWLVQAMVKGSAAESGLLFHGSLFRDAPKIRKVHELYFNVEEATLAYDPAWPVLQALDATVYINNAKVESHHGTATIFASELEQIEVSLPITPEGVADTIHVSGAIRGDFSDAVKVLNETPLATITGEMASTWAASGKVAGEIRLNVPLGPRAGEPVKVKVSVDIDGGDLLMGNANFAVNAIVGNVSYTSDKGLTAAPFDALIFGEPARHEILSTLDSAGTLREILVVGDGRVDVEELYTWSEQALLTKAAGKFDYHSAIRVPTGGAKGGLSVEITSNLLGVAIDLPQPMGKLALDPMPMNYQQTFFESSDEVGLTLGDRVKALLKRREGILVGGQVHFGLSPMGAVAFDKLRVTGELQRADYGLWQQLSEDLASRMEISLASEVAQTLDSVDLHVEHFTVFGFELESIDLNVSRREQAWNVAVQNEILKGIVGVPDEAEIPIDLDLEYLKFITQDDNIDLFENLDPGDLVAVNFRTKRLMKDAEDYGSWAFNFRPNTQGGRFESLTANVKGLQIDSSASIDWRVSDVGQQSHFVGTVKANDLAVALKQWGFASSIQGNDFVFESDIQWAGSPTMIEFDVIEGHITISAKGGRFVQAESSTGALKLLGIFDFASLAKRFRFDFSDIVNEGFSFNKINGGARFNRGVVDVLQPITIEGSSSIFRVGGQLNTNTGALDSDLIVTLPVSRNLPWYAAYSALANQLVGAGVFIAQKIFEDQINKMTSAKYKVTGTVDLPVIEFVSIFSDSVRETPEVEPTTETISEDRKDSAVASPQAPE